MLISFLKSSACLLFFILLWLSPSFKNNITRLFLRFEDFLTVYKKPVLAVIIGLYTCLTVFLQFRHPLDGDETQAWLIARDSPSLWKLFAQMGYEGSPGLWHTILFPFAKSGVHFYVIYFLNHLFAIGAVLLWLKFAPFPLFVRFLFPFIHIFLTEYSINARSYALSIFLLFLALTLYKKHFNKWWLWSFVFLLFANTNIPAALLTCGFALFLFLKWMFLKSVTDGKAIWIIAVGLVLVCMQVYPPKDLAQELSAFKFQINVTEITVGVITGAASLSIFIYLVLILHVAISLKSKYALLGLLATQSALFFLFLFKYGGALRHHFYLILSILMFLWTVDVKPTRKNSLQICLSFILLLMVTTAAGWALNNSKNYSSWKMEMASFINYNIKPDSTTFIACYPGNLSASILPYVPFRFMYFADEQRWGSFTIWNEQRVSGNFNPGIIKNLIDLSTDHVGYKSYYYLTIKELPLDSVNYYHVKQLKKTTNHYIASAAKHWGSIYLYKLPKDSIRLPQKATRK